MLALLLIVATASLAGAAVWRLVARRREPLAEVLDLGMTGAAEPEEPTPEDGPGFAFRAAREPVHWTAVLRIGLIVAVVASALAAALYYAGFLIKSQLDRVLGS